jgi:glycosyltransferase involved in cell wall biosynthesis
MPNNKVSIVISNHNYSEFLRTCIESVLSQTYPGIELIVVDDGSTDCSRDILQEYGNRAKIIFKERGGETSSRNTGFLYATGDIVAFLDADDFLKPGAVENVVRNWRLSYSKFQFPLLVVDRQGRANGLLMPRCRLDSGRVDHLLVCTGRYITAPNSGNFYARWLLERIMPVPEEEWPESVDSYAATFAGFYGEIGASREPLGFYRVHGSNASGAVGGELVDPSQVERLISHGIRLKTLIQRVARELHLSPNPGIVTSHWMYLKLELTQLKLSKDIRLKKLLTRGKWMIVSALTAPELTLLKRGQLIGWTIGTVLLPRCFAQPIMKAAFELTPAAWLPRALRRL